MASNQRARPFLNPNVIPSHRSYAISQPLVTQSILILVGATPNVILCDET
jgi:hypothetical protein